MTDQITDATDNAQAPDAPVTDITETTPEVAPERTGTLAVEPTVEPATNSLLDLITDEELKGSKSLAKFKDVNAMAKSLIHLEKKLGAPREDSVEYKSEDYKHDLPEGYTANDSLLGLVKDKAVELGIKPNDFKALVEAFTGGDLEAMNQLTQDKQDQSAQMQESLKAEWGNKYDERLAAADKTWQHFTTAEDDKILESLQPNAKLAIAKMMDNISQQITIPSIGKPEGGGSNPIDTAKALSMISEIRSNSDMDPQEKSRELSKLYPIAYANETAQELGVSTTGLDLSKLR